MRQLTLKKRDESSFALEKISTECSIMNSVSASFKTNPTNLDHIIPQDFKTVLKLPDSHTWNDDDHPPSLSTHEQEEVPVVDLANPEAATLIRQACEKWGVFQVTNHSVPVELLNQIEFQSQRLFGLPKSKQVLALRSEEDCIGYGMPRISAFFSKLMWFEGFTIMGSPLHHARQLWPNHHFDFCNVMVEYQKQLKGLSESILGLIFMSLGLTQEDVIWLEPKNGSEQSQAALQLNSYPICPDPNRAMGLAPHTDSSLLTVLYQTNNIGGLQVLRENVGWVTVQPVATAFVVNVGDLMHIICNGRFKSTLHRATVNNTDHRLSIAYFYGPPKDVELSPFVKLIDHDHPMLYRTVTWKEYLDIKATHFDKALDLIRYDVQ